MPAPVATTNLVGRDVEVRRALDLLGRHRLVTLVGPGGVGKTRLAVELANELETEVDIVAFVELAPLTDPSRIAGEIQRAIGPGAGGGDGDWRHLDVASVLVVLDNCEHLQGGVAPIVGSILGTSRRTRVLATSTTPLAIRPEVLLDVVPLPVGHPGAAGALAPESPAEPGDPGDLSPAVELFWARAEAARSDLTVDDRALVLMTEICHHLDGLPLAIEIVAAQVRAFPLEHLAQVVATDPAFVAHPWRDAEDRHRSLVANVEWSRRLLTDEEVDALSALAVLAPDFGLDSAAAMLDLPAVDTHRIVASLVQRSMLVSDDQTGRYRMLNHLRRVCLDSLEPAHLRVLQGRRARWCAELAARWGRGATEPEALADEARADAANLHAAVDWCIAEGDHDRLVAVIGPVAIAWVHVGWPVDPQAWSAAARAVVDWRPELALTVRLALGYHWGWVGDPRAALDEVVAVAERSDPVELPQVHGNALVQWAYLESLLDPGSAAVEPRFRRAIEVLDAGGVVWGQAWARFYLARFVEPGDRRQAADLHAAGLDLIADHDLPVLGGLFTDGQAQMALSEGRADRALPLAARSRALHHRGGYPEGEATSANTEGFAHSALANPEAASRCHTWALRTALHLRHEGLAADSLAGLALVAAGRGRARLAARLAGAAEQGPERVTDLVGRRFTEVPEALEALLDDAELAADRAAGRAAERIDALAWVADGVGPADLPDRATPRPLVDPLSDRELTVLRLLRGDLTQRQIAAELIVAPSTVKSHVKAIYRKLGVASRAQAVERAGQLGLI